MDKTKLIALSILVMLFCIVFSGCLEDSKSNEDKTPVATKGENLLIDPGFEDIYSIPFLIWNMAGFTTYNIGTIYNNNNEIIGAKIENTTLRFHNEINYNGSYSAYIHGVDLYSGDVITNWNQKINDSDVIPHGKDIELSCMIRTRDAGEVILLIQCLSEDIMSTDYLLKDLQISRSYENITGTNGWKEYTIKLSKVPDETKAIYVRLGLKGTGEVWFDDAQLYTVTVKSPLP